MRLVLIPRMQQCVESLFDALKKNWFLHDTQITSEAIRQRDFENRTEGFRAIRLSVFSRYRHAQGSNHPTRENAILAEDQANKDAPLPREFKSTKLQKQSNASAQKS